MNEEVKKDFDHTINHFRGETATLRTGRATPSLVEQISVEAYDSVTPLIHIASITAPDPKTIVVEPWDKTILKKIEVAIQSSNLNLSPVVDGSMLRISLPPLNEENRLALVKQLHAMGESSRVSLRKHREKAKNNINIEEENGKIGEDDKFKAIKELDELLKKYSLSIKEIIDLKEKEIMQI